MSRFARVVAFGLALASVPSVGCFKSGPVGRVNILEGRAKDTRGTYLGLPLKSGQVVLTESPDTTSFAFSLIPEKFFPFTHVAILSMEDGEPWVYDVTGGVATIPTHSRMLDNVSGTLFRRPLMEYASGNMHTEIYEPPPGTDRARMIAYVQKLYAGGKVAFDNRFDHRDHSALYCSELVALAIEAGGGEAPRPVKNSLHPSVQGALKFLGVPEDESLPVGLFAPQDRFVAALGPFQSRTQAWAYFAAKREIYRRFGADQRLGFVLSLSGQGELGVRPEIVAYADEASHLFDAEPNPPKPGDPRIAEATVALANRKFGPFDGGTTVATQSSPATRAP